MATYIVDETLPLREIPGSFGLPFFGAISDRIDYFYKKGEEEFFRSRIEKYNSTVFRVNLPPGPFIAKNPKVVCVLDAKSFPIIFDLDKVDKTDVLTGTFIATTGFTGGFRVLSYLDPSNPKHRALKGFVLSIVARMHKELVPNFHSAASIMFDDLEAELSSKGQADFNAISDKMSLDFFFRVFGNKSLYETSMAQKGKSNLDKWIAIQLFPKITLGIKFLPNCVEDLLLHTFPYPHGLVQSGYEKVHDVFHEAIRPLIEEAEAQYGIAGDEASHNMMFLLVVNAYAGSKLLFPSLLNYVGTAGEGLHRRLAGEIRSVVEEEGGAVTLNGLNRMSLTKSVVYELLRIEPPVQFQYARAKEDITVSSHDANYVIKKDELICGFQPIATRDSRVFEDAEKFVPDRFLGEGEKLLKYVYWSNGRELDGFPTVDNKQCAGKEIVPLLARLMLVEFFLRYDTFEVEVTKLPLGTSVTFKSVTKAKSK